MLSLKQRMGRGRKDVSQRMPCVALASYKMHSKSCKEVVERCKIANCYAMMNVSTIAKLDASLTARSRDR